MTIDISKLISFGWSPHFSSQIDADDLTSMIPVRVIEVLRNHIRVIGPSVERLMPSFRASKGDDESYATVGDWILLDNESFQPRRLLERKSLFKRRAPGVVCRVQLLAANVDTLFIVSSCNQDFNIARMERYLALACEAEVTPVIVLTKADLTDTPETYTESAAQLIPGIQVECLDARDPAAVACLASWAMPNQTVAFVGSSGVGKSTLINTLIGTSNIETQGIREGDARGRHTTSSRTLYRLPAGGWLMDTPGMRELQLTDVSSGLEEVFADINSIAENCRFADCEHDKEPGCAVQVAISENTLDERRLKHWRKLVAEEAYNTESLAERRKRSKEFGKMVKRVKAAKSKS